MAILLTEPGAEALGGVIDALREWQVDGAPVQLHPGDLGWHWRFGAQAAAASIRAWSRAGQILGVGMLDDHNTLRLAVAPSSQQDVELAGAMVGDLTTADRGVLQAGKACVEAPAGALVRDLVRHAGWVEGERWTALRRDLALPVQNQALGTGLRIEVIGPEQASARAAVQRAAFATSTFSEERWRAMAAGPLYADARCLVAFDAQGAEDVAVAAVTVWSAGAGRPGLLEPMGVHRDHRGHGHGTAITLAAAAALRDLGASSAVVCTRSANVGGIATYRAAGFGDLAETPDLCRQA